MTSANAGAINWRRAGRDVDMLRHGDWRAGVQEGICLCKALWGLSW